MMDKNGTVHTCSWCHKDVAEENFALHEMHCSRFLSLCPDCGETVPSELVEQHREEQHTQVRCSKCNQKMERCHLEDHEENECVERLQVCSFCELELPWKLVDEHRLACGSRTERCVDCGRYVKLCEQPQHDSTCSASKNTPKIPRIVRKTHGVQKSVTCMICRKSFPAEEIYEHELKCCDADGQKDDTESSRLGARPRTNGVDPTQIGSCPHCDLALPLLTLNWHQVKCQRYSRLKGDIF